MMPKRCWYKWLENLWSIIKFQYNHLSVSRALLFCRSIWPTWTRRDTHVVVNTRLIFLKGRTILTSIRLCSLSFFLSPLSLSHTLRGCTTEKVSLALPSQLHTADRMVVCWDKNLHRLKYVRILCFLRYFGQLHILRLIEIPSGINLWVSLVWKELCLGRRKD